MRLPRTFLPDPFILALLLSVLLASLLPARGQAKLLVDQAANGAIMLLFFLHGARLSREAALSALTHWRLHLTILAISFVLFPLLGLLLSRAIAQAFPASLWLGLLFLCALPSTVQASIAFTSTAGGNVAGAVTAAAASNLLAIVLTPLLLSLLASMHGAAVPLSGITRIVTLLLLPFVLGHLLRPWIGAWVARHKRLLMFSDRGTIVLAVYSAFSAAVVAGLWQQLPLAMLINLGVMLIALLLVIVAASWQISGVLGFNRADRIAILFCGSKKSLASGVPMARVLVPGPDLGMTLLPLMIFHQAQLMLCAWLATRLAKQPAKDTTHG